MRKYPAPSWVNRAYTIFTGNDDDDDDGDDDEGPFTRRTRRSACWRSGPDSADQTGCTASGTGCAPEAGALEEPAYWKRCGPAVALPGCTFGTVPATQTPPTADRCPLGRRKYPAAATTPPANFPAAYSNSADAVGRRALPTTNFPPSRWAYSWRGHGVEPLQRLLLPCCSGSYSGWPPRQLLQPLLPTRMMTKACTRTIRACGHCCCCSAKRMTRVVPTRSVCPPGGIRTRQTPSVPAWGRAACGSSSTGDTRSGPWPAGASFAIDPRAART